jgi:hypothetical protein
LVIITEPTQFGQKVDMSEPNASFPNSSLGAVFRIRLLEMYIRIQPKILVDPDAGCTERDSSRDPAKLSHRNFQFLTAFNK